MTIHDYWICSDCNTICQTGQSHYCDVAAERWKQRQDRLDFGSIGEAIANLRSELPPDVHQVHDLIVAQFLMNGRVETTLKDGRRYLYDFERKEQEYSWFRLTQFR